MNNEYKQLTRSTSDRMIAGVCAGLGEYLNIDPSIIRIIWLVSILIYGVGLLLYLVMWIVLPER